MRTHRTRKQMFDDTFLNTSWVEFTSMPRFKAVSSLLQCKDQTPLIHVCEIGQYSIKGRVLVAYWALITPTVFQ